MMLVIFYKQTVNLTNLQIFAQKVIWNMFGLQFELKVHVFEEPFQSMHLARAVKTSFIKPLFNFDFELRLRSCYRVIKRFRRIISVFECW